MRRLPLVLLVLLAVAPAGCGNERRSASQTSPEPAKATQMLDYPTVGLRLELPRNFAVDKAQRPEVFRSTFNSAAVSAYAYRRREELPSNEKELKNALKRLEKAAKERSSSYKLSESRTLRVDGARALELLGRQTLSQSPVRTRSLHVFKGKAEYVIELLAPPRDFDRLDESVFGLIRDSLDVTGKVPKDPGGLQRGAVPPFDGVS